MAKIPHKPAERRTFLRSKLVSLAATCGSALLGFRMLLGRHPHPEQPKRRSFVVGLFGVAISALGIVSLFGYVTNLEAADGWGIWTRMTVPTAVGSITLGFRLIIFAWREGTAADTGMPPWAPLLGGLGILLIALLLGRAFSARERFRPAWIIRNELANVKEEIQEDIGARILALMYMANHWELREAMSRVEWAIAARHYLRHQPGYQAIGRVDPTFSVRWIEPSIDKEVLQGFDLFRSNLTVATVSPHA